MISKKKRVKIPFTNINKLSKNLGFVIEEVNVNVCKNYNIKNFKKEIRKDFHGMKLFQVRDWLLTDMIDYFEASFDEFFLIHGYNNGTVIRDYIRNDFKKEFQRIFNHLTLTLNMEHEGTTSVRVSKK
ncbi:MAG: hypothetical protein HeimC3_50110 [Candidatus Heimdallarchaeota archaeon LC_3]|nr:MAG: hypothetical protein HeimC3_50110 [Candidatus Heimdallarchaeota archaeon LC_3]